MSVQSSSDLKKNPKKPKPTHPNKQRKKMTKTQLLEKVENLG